MSLHASQTSLAACTCTNRQGLIKLLFTTIHLLHMNQLPVLCLPSKALQNLFSVTHTHTHNSSPPHTQTHTHTPVWCNLELMIADSSNLFCCLFCLESVSTQLSEVTLNQYPTKKGRVPLLRSFHMDRFETSGRSPSGSLRMHYLQAFEG